MCYHRNKESVNIRKNHKKEHEANGIKGCSVITITLFG